MLWGTVGGELIRNGLLAIKGTRLRGRGTRWKSSSRRVLRRELMGDTVGVGGIVSRRAGLLVVLLLIHGWVGHDEGNVSFLDLTKETGGIPPEREVVNELEVTE